MAISIQLIQQSVDGNHLDLSCKELIDKDIEVICSFLKDNPHITSLDLTDNQIGDEGAKALTTNTSLTSLDISFNLIDDESAKTLATNTTLTSLTLVRNQFGYEGAKALATNTTLTSLDIRYNEIGTKGAKALATNTTLTSLEISCNQIGTEGAKALAANTTLTALNIHSNGIQNPKDIEQVFANNYGVLKLGGINTDNLTSILKRNNTIHCVVLPFIDLHLKQHADNDNETISKAIDLIKTLVPDWESLSQEHYVSEILRLLTGIGFLKQESVQNLEQTFYHYTLEHLLPDFTHRTLQHIANLRLSELLMFNKAYQSNPEALQLSLYGLRQDLENEAFAELARQALFKLIHPETQFTAEARASFNQEVVLLSHNTWRKLVQKALNTLSQGFNASPEEINVLATLLKPHRYDLSLAGKSPHLMDALKKKYPESQSFTTPEHSLLMMQANKDTLVIPLSSELAKDNHEINSVIDNANALNEHLFNLKEALCKQYIPDMQLLETPKEDELSISISATPLGFFGKSQHKDCQYNNNNETQALETKP